MIQFRMGIKPTDEFNVVAIEIVKRIESVRHHINRPLRVAIDGLDTSGKTVFADNLVDPVTNRHHHAIRATVDAFHNPRAVRYQKGRLSPEGFFHDSYNYQGLIENLLNPLGEGGSRKYKKAIFDYGADSLVNSPEETAPEDAILLFDGIFLLRPELRDYWDYSIFLKIDFNTMLDRAKIRDRKNFASEEELVNVYMERYIKGERMYLAECKPESTAKMVIDNADYLKPKIIR